jgi:hypothetical protein
MKPATIYTQLQKVTVIYQFHNSRMGFQNSITVDAISNEHALEIAKKEVAMCYGSGMLKRFSFKIK